MSDRDNWMTPRWFCDMVHEVMDGIELDPMSSEEANENVKAKRFFGRCRGVLYVDAFEMSWSARSLYLNPPYSNGLIAQSIAKLVSELDNIDQAIVLTNAIHDTKYGNALLRHCTALCLPARRIQFDAPPGVKKTSNRFNQMVTYFGPRPRAFERVFQDLGAVFE